MTDAARFPRALLTTVMSALLLVACGAGSPSSGSATTPARSSASPGQTTPRSLPLNPPLSHVHGAVVRGADLLIGTHHGMFRVSTDTGTSQLVGTAEADFMGLSADASGALVASGHPGQGLGNADPLGLVTSSDGGDTWETRSLAGEIDFHALATRGDVVVGWSTRGSLLWSEDAGLTWEQGPEASATSLAWFGDDVWMATVDQGLLAWRPGAADLVRRDVNGIVVASSPDSSVIWRLDVDGSVHRSVDGTSWQGIGTVSAVEAFAADDTRAFVVTAEQVMVLAVP